MESEQRRAPPGLMTAAVGVSAGGYRELLAVHDEGRKQDQDRTGEMGPPIGDPSEDQEDHASCPDNGVQKMVQRTANQGNAAPNNGKHERGDDGEKATSNLVQIVGEVGLCVPEWEGQLGEREQEDGNE